MKKIIALVLFFGAVAFLMPYSWLLLTTAYDSPLPEPETPSQPEASTTTGDDSQPPEDSALETVDTVYQKEEFLIYCIDREGVLTIPVKEYIIGALAAEMSLDVPKEALKAQAIAAYSYAVARAENKEAGDSPMNSDFSANPSKYEVFLTEEEMRYLWGNSYDENYAFLSEIVEEVGARLLIYDGEPALSCYFPLSNGSTLESEHFFDVELPYLISVESPYDSTSIEYEQKITFTSQQIFDVLTTEFEGAVLEDDPFSWLSEPNYTDSGYLIDITAGGILIKGEELRQALGLRSTSMQIEYADNIFIFTTQGIGHGVGMSQYGARMMAEQGYTYDIILKYYYPGCEIS